jgi:hypothetical protein
MARVKAAATPEALDTLWQEALDAQSAGELTSAQIDRLDTEIAKRGATLEVEAAQ